MRIIGSTKPVAYSWAFLFYPGNFSAPERTKKTGESVCRHIVVYVLTDYHASRLARENPLGKRVNRVGLTVSKRLGGAVVRSRVRRILRAAYRQLEAEQNIKKGKLIVIAAKEAACSAKSTDIYKDLLYAAKKLSLYAGSDSHKNGQRPECASGSQAETSEK